MRLSRLMMTLPIAVIAMLGAASCAADAHPVEASPVDAPVATSTVRPGDDLLTTRGSLMVVDDGQKAPRLCWPEKGDEPWPPYCRGVELASWDWDAVGGAAIERDGARTGDYVVAGTYSFEEDVFRVESATTTGRYDEQDWSACPEEDERSPWNEDGIVVDEQGSQMVAQQFGVGVYQSWANKCGTLMIGVAYDDGRIQAWADEELGEGEIGLMPMLQKVGDVVSVQAFFSMYLATPARMLVVDRGDGSGAQLCTTFADRNDPANCGEAIELVDWDWNDVSGPEHDVDGVKWGEYFVEGYYVSPEGTLDVTSASADGSDIGRSLPEPCETGGVHGDEEVSAYVNTQLGIPVIDTWAGFDDGSPIVCVGVASDNGSVQAAVNDEFGDGSVVVISLLAHRE